MCIRIIIFLHSHEEIAAKFDQLDRDGNGVLSPDEVKYKYFTLWYSHEGNITLC